MPGNLLWWGLYVLVGLWAQKIFPGADAMVPGLILCLQEKNTRQTALFLAFCLLLQEGTGSLPFGASIVWYGLAVALYFLGGLFFMSGNLMFVLMLALALGLGRALLFSVLGLLHPISLSLSDKAVICLLQAALVPLLWMPAMKLRRKALLHADQH